MAKNLHVTVNSVDIAKRNLKKVTYPAVGTSLKKINRAVNGSSQREYWRNEIPLYSGGRTDESGSWNSVKNLYNRGQTFVFGNTMYTTSNSNNNSFHGTLLYPSNKVLVAMNDTITIDISSTNQARPEARIVDTNLGALAPWNVIICVAFLEEVPADFPQTFDINTWLQDKNYVEIAYAGGTGNDTDAKIFYPGTYTKKVPHSGLYYPCIVVHGYDSSTKNLALNNFKIT